MTSFSLSSARRTLAVAAVAALALVACGSDADDADGSAEAPAADSNGSESAAALQQVGVVEFEVGTQLPPFAEGADAAVGRPSPVVEGQRFDGSAITIGGPSDSATLYVFLAHWCPACNAEVPELVELEADGRVPDDVDIVGVSTAVVADRPNYPPSEWLEDNDWPFDAFADDEQGTAISVFGGTSFPFAVLVGEDGTVLARSAGSSSADEILEFIEAGLATA